jgi:flagellar hook-associated protein 1 FlgK
VTSNTNGSYNVFVGSGQQLVVGSQVTMMSAEPASADRSRNVIGLVGPTGNIQELPESLISGGKLGGLLSFRSEALDASFNQLGLMATSFTQTFIAQHALGATCSATPTAAPILSASSFGRCARCHPQSKTQPAARRFPLPDPVTTNGTNYYSNLTASDYRLSFESGALTLTRLSDNTAWTVPTWGPSTPNWPAARRLHAVGRRGFCQWR